MSRVTGRQLGGLFSESQSCPSLVLHTRSSVSSPPYSVAEYEIWRVVGFCPPYLSLYLSVRLHHGGGEGRVCVSPPIMDWGRTPKCPLSREPRWEEGMESGC